VGSLTVVAGRRDGMHKMTESCAKYDERIEPDWLRQSDVKEE
jgi:hypothetical protein